MLRDSLLVLHCADLHLGKNRKYDDYLQQQEFMLSGIIDQVKAACKNNPSSDIVLSVAGDVFDRNQDTRREEFCLFLTAFMAPLIKLREAYPNLDAYFIDGNHDRTGNPDDPSILSSIARLFGGNIEFAVVTPKFSEKRGMLMLPYAGYSAKKMRAIIDEFKPNFVMAHECLARMQTDQGWSPPRDQDHYLEINEVLDDTAVAGVFLGDIHKCQALDTKEICWYSGSPITLDHGHKLPKGVLHHYYGKSKGIYNQVKKPILHSIEDSRIKSHFQLGVIDDLDNIPWEKCYTHLDSYLSMVVTPEVYAEIHGRIGGFFSNRQVTFSFKEAEALHAESPEEKDPQTTHEYYKVAIRDWTKLNCENLTESLKDEFVARTEKLFESRS